MSARQVGARRLIGLLMARGGLSGLADKMGIVVIVGAAAFAPAACGAALGGPLVTRFGGPAIFLAAGAANILGAGLLAWLLLAGAAAPWMIAVLVGAAAVLDIPAVVAAENRRPPLARRARLRLFRVNAWDDLLEQGATVAGPALGGIAFTTLGAGKAAVVVAMLACAAFMARPVTACVLLRGPLEASPAWP